MFRFDIKNTVAVGRVYVVDNVDLSPDFVVLELPPPVVCALKRT